MGSQKNPRAFSSSSDPDTSSATPLVKFHSFYGLLTCSLNEKIEGNETKKKKNKAKELDKNKRKNEIKGKNRDKMIKKKNK